MASPANLVSALLAVGLCCPRCHGGLRDETHAGEGSLHCEPCHAEYRVLRGIPDMRIAPDPYIGIEADRAKGLRLAQEPVRSWHALASRYYDITLDTVPPAQARRFSDGLHAAESRAAAALDAWELLASRRVTAADAILDVGAGTAPLLTAIGRRHPARRAPLVGVDVAFRWLVVGQQRLADAGVPALLVCACAEALPFRAEGFDLAMSQATLENVRDARAAVQEMRRVVRPGGQTWISTANRLTPAPDPHLGLPAGGLLPRALVDAMARRQGALPPQRALLARHELDRLLHDAQFAHIAFGVPAVTEEQRARAGAIVRIAAGLYEFARTQRPLRHALTFVGPTIMATASVPGASAGAAGTPAAGLTVR